jgi:hypothetical protein
MPDAMTPFDRAVRAAIYQLFVDQVRTVDPQALARRFGWGRSEVSDSLQRLGGERRIVLAEDGSVRMAHPFSGVPTAYISSIEDRWWWANCAWDALAILAPLGDGEARGPHGLSWRVDGGRVQPEGIVHLVVPARSFWEDVGFT